MDRARLQALSVNSICTPVVIEPATVENFGGRNPCRDYMQKNLDQLFLKTMPLARCTGAEVVVLSNGTCADLSRLVDLEKDEDLARLEADCERLPTKREALFARFLEDQICSQRVFSSRAQYLDLLPSKSVTALVRGVSDGSVQAMRCRISRYWRETLKMIKRVRFDSKFLFVKQKPKGQMKIGIIDNLFFSGKKH